MQGILSRAAERCQRAGVPFTSEQQRRLQSQMHSIEELLALNDDRFKALTATDGTDVRVHHHSPARPSSLPLHLVISR